MKTTLYIQNLKCEHCKTIILQELSKLKNITNTFIKSQYATVTFEHLYPEDVEIVKQMLSKIGYPPFGEKNNYFKKSKSNLSATENKTLNHK